MQGKEAWSRMGLKKYEKTMNAKMSIMIVFL